MEKKKWKRPQLTIVLKGEPEEFVLAGCKTKVSTGPKEDHSACKIADASVCPGDCEGINFS